MSIIGNIKNFFEKKIDINEIVAISDISAKVAYKKLAIHIAATYISQAISKCEIKFYKNGKENNKSLEYYLFNVAPNRNECSSQFLNKLVYKLLTEPDGVLVITSNDKFYIAESFQREAHPMSGDIFTSVSLENLSLNRTYKRDEVMYFKLEDENVKSLIDSMYQDYGKAIDSALSAFLKNNADKYKMKIEADKIFGKDVEVAYKEILSKQIKQFVNADGGVFPEYKGYTLTSFNDKGNQSTPSNLIELRKDTFEITGESYKIPKSMMEGNINNVKDVVNTFITFAVTPVTTLIGDVITKDLYTFQEWVKGTKAVVDTSTIPFQSILDTADGISKLIANTVVNPNEARKIIGLDNIDEDFMNQYFITKNNSKAEDVMNGLIDGISESGKE